MSKTILLEKRIAKLEEEIDKYANVPEIDNELRNEFIDELNIFIRQCTAKFNERIGSTDDKILRKTKSYKIIKSLKDAWINAAKK